jgi:hypothetical protein
MPEDSQKRFQTFLFFLPLSGSGSGSSSSTLIKRTFQSEMLQAHSNLGSVAEQCHRHQSTAQFRLGPETEKVATRYTQFNASGNYLFTYNQRF